MNTATFRATSPIQSNSLIHSYRYQSNQMITKIRSVLKIETKSKLATSQNKRHKQIRASSNICPITRNITLSSEMNSPTNRVSNSSFQMKFYDQCNDNLNKKMILFSDNNSQSQTFQKFYPLLPSSPTLQAEKGQTVLTEQSYNSNSKGLQNNNLPFFFERKQTNLDNLLATDRIPLKERPSTSTNKQGNHDRKQFSHHQDPQFFLSSTPINIENAQSNERAQIFRQKSDQQIEVPTFKKPKKITTTVVATMLRKNEIIRQILTQGLKLSEQTLRSPQVFQSNITSNINTNNNTKSNGTNREIKISREGSRQYLLVSPHSQQQQISENSPQRHLVLKQHSYQQQQEQQQQQSQQQYQQQQLQFYQPLQTQFSGSQLSSPISFQNSYLQQRLHQGDLIEEQNGKETNIISKSFQKRRAQTPKLNNFLIQKGSMIPRHPLSSVSPKFSMNPAALNKKEDPLTKQQSPLKCDRGEQTQEENLSFISDINNHGENSKCSSLGQLEHLQIAQQQSEEKQSKYSHKQIHFPEKIKMINNSSKQNHSIGNLEGLIVNQPSLGSIKSLIIRDSNILSSRTNLAQVKRSHQNIIQEAQLGEKHQQKIRKISMRGWSFTIENEEQLQGDKKC